jgi:hypothetical protein
MFRPALGSIQPSIQCEPGALFLGIKLLGLEADDLLSPTPPIRLHGMVLNQLITGTTLPFLSVSFVFTARDYFEINL